MKTIIIEDVSRDRLFLDHISINQLMLSGKRILFEIYQSEQLVEVFQLKMYLGYPTCTRYTLESLLDSWGMPVANNFGVRSQGDRLVENDEIQQWIKKYVRDKTNHSYNDNGDCCTIEIKMIDTMEEFKQYVMSLLMEDW